MNSTVESLVAAKILCAWDDGCPVATHDASVAADMAAIARRRWDSYLRRNANVADTFENRINDLARGLATKFERGGWPTVGPLMNDYTWLAEQIVPILAADR